MFKHESNPLNDTGSHDQKPTDVGLSLDKILHLLSNSRRRTALAYLIHTQTPVDFTELVDHVAEREYDAPIEDISGEERHTIYTSLYQTHLPTLNQAEIVHYERVSGEIDRGPNFGLVENYFSRLSQRSLMDRLASGVADTVAHL